MSKRVGELFTGGLDSDLSVSEVVSGGHLAFVMRYTEGTAEELLSAGDVERLADTLDEWLRGRGARPMFRTPKLDPTLRAEPTSEPEGGGPFGF